ncbi:chemotaxis protein CheB [Caulobacter segnis]
MLFRSATPARRASNAVRVILMTGMGDDGAARHGRDEQAGAFTLAQDEASARWCLACPRKRSRWAASTAWFHCRTWRPRCCARRAGRAEDASLSVYSAANEVMAALCRAKFLALLGLRLRRPTSPTAPTKSYRLGQRATRGAVCRG